MGRDWRQRHPLESSGVQKPQGASQELALSLQGVAVPPGVQELVAVPPGVQELVEGVQEMVAVPPGVQESPPAPPAHQLLGGSSSGRETGTGTGGQHWQFW